MLLAGLRPIVFPDGRLLAVGIPLMPAFQLPAKKTRLMLPLVRAAPQHQGILLPDAAAGQVKACVFECLAEVQPLGIGMEYIDGSIRLHVLFHIDEGREEELVELIVRHIVILDFTGCFFHIDVIRRVRQHHVGLLPRHQPFIGFRQRRIAADDTVITENPDISFPGNSRLFQFAVHIEVIFLDFLVVHFREKLLDLWCLEARQVDVEVDALQIDDEVSQELFVPGTCDFVERDVECLDLMLILDMDDDTLDFFIAQVLEDRQTLMSADDGHVVVDDDGFHIAELLDGLLDFLVFFIAGLQLFPGVIGCRLQRLGGQHFPFHIRCLHVLSPL